ncbi:MAG: ErfK/YbiS/YcfS/YnhG family protein [Lacrimispora sp.]|jgi:lipoprotein-anchoring transpeptidase ErfK/SrfK|nr:ErfK/YbiS/YcfS/YnhG family protein [Lacrimispora sp.]
MSRKQSHAGTIWIIAFLTALFMLAGSVVALADDASKFVPGTKINGVLVGGMTVEEAKVQIEGFYGREYQLTIKEKGGTSEVIKGSDIQYRVVITDGLQNILAQQNNNGRLAGPDIENSSVLKSTVTYQEEKLKERLDSLACVSNKDIVVTQDAKISDWQEGQPFTVIAEVQGNSVNRRKLDEVARAALTQETRQISLEEKNCYDTVTVTSGDSELAARCAALNQIREMKITYLFGNQSEVLNGEQLCTWIEGADQTGIHISGAKAAEYIQSMAVKYDTAGKARPFKAADGRDLSVSGAYGWQMNQEAETQALIAMIKSGQSQERTPQYSLAAADRNVDWGGNYVEADMAAQHVYMYQNGSVIWDSPCVTGNVSKKLTTPEGIYTLNYKQTDRVLRGEKKPDGTYEYESHVDYWMPFNGGIGFHDASWRSKFGGSIYQTGGSHGCINLPPQKAKALYELIYTGIPVICHY